MASTAPIMESIASLEKELARLKAALAESGVQLPAKAGKAKKEKKERDPDAPPPKANPYFEFLNGRIRPLLKEHKGDMKLPGTVAPLFAKHLKDTIEDAYSMEDDAIVAAFEEWATPENLVPPARKAKDSGSESGSVAGSEPKADKPKRVLSDEQKAKMKAGREAAKAAKDAEKAASAGAVAKEAPKPKFQKKEKTYTLKELQDWDSLEIDGTEFGVNKRGDVINGEGEFQGVWDGKELNRAAPLPADWAQVMA